MGDMPGRSALDWNVVASVNPDRYRGARHLLAGFGEVAGTAYYNVIVLTVPDVAAFAERLRRLYETAPDACNALSRVEPAQWVFTFQSAEEFEREGRAIAVKLAPRLIGKRFHVRMHRRGFKGRLSSQDEERTFDGAILECLAQRGESAEVTFDDPDAIVSVETVDNRAGMSLWSREDLERYPFLRLD